MQLSYRAGVGELIWAMTTCRPDLAFASVKLSQSNSCPHKIHFHGLKQALKYLFTSKEDGIYFWQTSPRMDLPEGPLPPIHSNKQDLLLDNRPEHDASVLLAYADSDFSGLWNKEFAPVDPSTAKSRSGWIIFYAGCPVSWASKLQSQVALSTTEAEYIAMSQALRDVIPVMNLLQEMRERDFQVICNEPYVYCKVIEDNSGIFI